MVLGHVEKVNINSNFSSKECNKLFSYKQLNHYCALLLLHNTLLCLIRDKIISHDIASKKPQLKAVFSMSLRWAIFNVETQRTVELSLIFIQCLLFRIKEYLYFLSTHPLLLQYAAQPGDSFQYFKCNA